MPVENSITVFLCFFSFLPVVVISGESIGKVSILDESKEINWSIFSASVEDCSLLRTVLSISLQASSQKVRLCSLGVSNAFVRNSSLCSSDTLGSFMIL